MSKIGDLDWCSLSERACLVTVQASTTLGIIMSAFTLCWFPFFVLALVRPFVSQPDLVIPRWLSSLFLWLGYANSFLNPVIYATTNKDFRLPFREILCLRYDVTPINSSCHLCPTAVRHRSE